MTKWNFVTIQLTFLIVNIVVVDMVFREVDILRVGMTFCDLTKFPSNRYWLTFLIDTLPLLELEDIVSNDLIVTMKSTSLSHIVDF